MLGSKQAFQIRTRSRSPRRRSPPRRTARESQRGSSDVDRSRRDDAVSDSRYSERRSDTRRESDGRLRRSDGGRDDGDRYRRPREMEESHRYRTSDRGSASATRPDYDRFSRSERQYHDRMTGTWREDSSSSRYRGPGRERGWERDRDRSGYGNGDREYDRGWRSERAPGVMEGNVRRRSMGSDSGFPPRSRSPHERRDRSVNDRKMSSGLLNLNPTDVPKADRYFHHDDRVDSSSSSTSRGRRRGNWDSSDVVTMTPLKWGHDMFDEFYGEGSTPPPDNDNEKPRTGSVVSKVSSSPKEDLKQEMALEEKEVGMEEVFVDEGDEDIVEHLKREAHGETLSNLNQ